MALDPIEQGLEVSRGFLSSIDSLIKSQIEGAWIDNLPGVDTVARNLDSLVTQSETAITNAENAIKNQIAPVIAQAVPNALSFITTLTQSLDSHLTQLLGNIATTEDVLTAAATAIQQRGPQLAGWIATNIVGAFGNATLDLLKTLETQEPEGINAVLDHLLSIPGAPPYFTTLITGLRNRGAEWEALSLPVILASIILGAVTASIEPFHDSISRIAYKELPAKIIDPSTILSLHLKGQISDATFIDYMLQNGFNPEMASWLLANQEQRITPDSAVIANMRGQMSDDEFYAELAQQGMDAGRARWLIETHRQLLGLDEIRTAFLRGRFNAKEHDAALALYGITETNAALMRQLYFFIPGPQDLIHMGIRNVFNPEIVERFTLSGDYPQAFEDAASQQGISPDWARKYWEAHWIMPGREAFFEMFQRTVDHKLDAHADKITLGDGTEVYNIIGRDTLNLALRDIDTPPFYRDKLTQVAYRPLTRIDIRRLHKLGLLTKAQVERAYLDLGNTPDHARLLAQFVVELNAAATKDQAKTLTTTLQRHVINLYIAGKLTEEQVNTTFVDLGFTSAEIKLFVTEADLVQATEKAAALEQGIGRLYTTGRITDKDATKRLMAANVPVDAMSLLFEKWDLQRDYAELPEHIHKHREVTESEILAALTDGLINEQTATGMLRDIGNDATSAATKIHLALYKSDIAARKTIIESIRASYINGVIEQPQASQRLDALFVPADQRDAYLGEWLLARETRTERIPIATLRDMFKGNYLKEPELLQHLKRHRFTDADAQLLIEYWRRQPAPRGLVDVSSA